jgi:hypothetical protein
MTYHVEYDFTGATLTHKSGSKFRWVDGVVTSVTAYSDPQRAARELAAAKRWAAKHL